MGSNGGEQTRVFAAPAGDFLTQVDWSPDGRWLTFLRRAGQTGTAVSEAFLPGAPNSTKIFDSPALQGFCWLSPSRLVLNLWEAPDQPTSNLWEIGVDPKNMEPIEKPRRLTNWAGFAVGDMSASRDGLRLAVTKRLDQTQLMVGDLADYGDKLLHLRRFTTDQRISWPGGWSPDSKWLLLQSDRTGHMSIYRQRLDSVNPEPVVTSQEANWNPVLSPDGQWVLYMVSQQAAGRLMRVPVTGGPAELVLEIKGPHDFVRSSKASKPGGRHATTGGNPAFRCPARTGTPCVLSEALGREVVFSSFDPAPSAKKTEIFRIATDDPTALFWDLSGDGTQVAYGIGNVHSLIRVRELIRHTTRDIYLSHWPELKTVGWSADGKSLFAAAYAPKGGSLLHVALDGKVAVLYKAPEAAELLKASPNGQHLAFGQVVSDINVWLIEGIPQ
jgi:hypothetical protein